MEVNHGRRGTSVMLRVNCLRVDSNEGGKVQLMCAGNRASSRLDGFAQSMRRVRFRARARRKAKLMPRILSAVPEQ